MPAFFRPKTLDEALAIRAERPVAVLAGGTDIYPAKASRAGWGEMRHPDVLDVSGIDALRGIEERSGRLRFGALTTWSELRRAPLPPAFDATKSAAREVGGLQVQNRGTLVGNICTASPAGDGIPCLLTLDAEIELASLSGRRVVPLAQFIPAYRHTLCRADELVTAILTPTPPPGAQGRFEKLGARRYLVISIVMAAGVLAADAHGRVTHARIAVGACTPVATRLTALEAALLGRPLADAADIAEPRHLAALTPIDDVRASAGYRHAAALALLRDLLTGFSAERARSVA